jgi:signal transduction histidine kinase
MVQARLLCGDSYYCLPARVLLASCRLYEEKPSLLQSPYRVRSAVPPEVFGTFTAALQEEPIDITSENARYLLLLCEEFGCEALSSRVRHFQASMNSGVLGDLETRNRLALLEDRFLTQSRQFAVFQQELLPITDRSRDFAALYDRVESLRRDLDRLSASTSQNFADARHAIEGVENRSSSDLVQLAQEFAEFAPPTHELVVELQRRVGSIDGAQRRLAADVDTLREFVRALPHVDLLPEPVPEPRAEFHSAILAVLPPVFQDFSDKRFELLYRGNEHGFTARDFHARCDGHQHTVTIIVTPLGCIFGGYTPVAWDSPKKRTAKCDPSSKSFLFTVQNPHTIPPTKFSLRRERRTMAITCCASFGPCFGEEDLTVVDDCRNKPFFGKGCETSHFGTVYTNTTGIADGGIVFTGEKTFLVQDIEVFQIHMD